MWRRLSAHYIVSLVKCSKVSENIVQHIKYVQSILLTPPPVTWPRLPHQIEELGSKAELYKPKVAINGPGFRFVQSSSMLCNLLHCKHILLCNCNPS